MVDVASVISLAVSIVNIPSNVKINQSQCQVLADRIALLIGYLRRVEGMASQQNKQDGDENDVSDSHSY